MSMLEKAAIDFILAKQSVKAAEDLGGSAPFGTFQKAIELEEKAFKKLESLAVLEIAKQWEQSSKD